MANALYDYGRNTFLTKGAEAAPIDWLNDNIKVALLDTNIYTVNLATHKYISDITAFGAGAIIFRSGNLAGKTAAAGVADATDETLVAVTGNGCAAFVIYKDTGADATSVLIAYIDTATGLPITPDGNNIVIVWSNGASKIFKL